MKNKQRKLIPKKTFSFLLVLSLLIATLSFSISAATPQKAMFLFKNKLYVSCNVASHSASSSYPYRKPIDIIDNVSGNGNAYAPFDCKVVAKATSEGNTIAIESLAKVEFADGTVDYMTIMVAHDDDISNISIGKTFKQGEVFYQEGNAGTSSGSHIHLETARGAYSKRSNSSQSIWAFVRSQSNVVYPHNALFLYENTTISKSGGYTWKYATEKTYTITYNANGGSGAPATQTGAANYTISSTKPTKTGYTFLGWSLSSTATSVSYVAGDKITLSADTTLYAVWRANNLKIYYNANGGSTHSDWYKIVSGIVYNQSDSAPYYQMWTYNNAQTNGLSNAVTLGLYKVGYTFVGWSTTSAGEKILDQDDVSLTPTDITANIKKGDCEITLYAIWKKDGSAPAAPKVSISKTSIIEGESVILTWEAVPNVTNYWVSGFKGDKRVMGEIDNTRSKTLLLEPGTYSFSVVAINSYGETTGNWVEFTVNQKTYTLSYKANGGSGAPANQSGATSYTVSSTQPIRIDYTFLGWSKSNSATTATYKAGDSITLTSNTTLYAVWKKNAVVPTPDEPASRELPEIKIKQPSTATINYGDTLVLTLEEVVIPKGYTVAWFVEGTGTSITVNEIGTECRVTSVANGNPTICAKLVDENGEPAINSNGEEIFDEITIISKAGFFQKLISFFKNLFGINRLIY